MIALVQPCGKPPCPEHGTMCAYHGDEPGRCPFCHASWDSCQEWHGCENKRNWTGKARITKPALARVRRLAHASQRHEMRDRDTFCTHTPKPSTNA